MPAFPWLVVVGISAAGTEEPESARPTEEIVVTGERVPRTLRDTPSSLAVLSRGELEAHPADRVEQVLASIPNVQLGNGSQGPSIRGQDTTGALQNLPAFLGGNRPRTTLVVDGRPQTYHEFVFGSAPLWDVERVEVFRSPQTATQGQNSIAGAIFVTTGDPQFHPEIRVRGIAGELKARQVSAMATGPLAGEQVALRVSGDFRYSRTSSRIADRVEGADPNHDVYGLARAKVLVEPSSMPRTRLMLTYAHVESQAPQIVGLTRPFRRRRDENGFYGTFRINVDSLTTAVRHDAGDLTTNLLVTAGDTLARRLAFPGLGQARIDGRDWSAEAVANWAPAGPVQLTAGLSRRHAELKQEIDLSVLAGRPHFRDWQDGTGIFGEMRLRIAPRAIATIGLRYQRDRQQRIGAFETSGGAIELDYDRTFDAWLPKVSLAYEFSPAVTAGVMVQRAYNPGGTTLRFDIGQPDNFEAEILWDYEAFVRATMAGGRLIVAANAFYYDMRNAQRARSIRIFAPNGLPVGFADQFNAPDARSYGAETSIAWRPANDLSARVSVGLLKSRIIEAGEGFAEFDGKEFDRAPHFSASGAIDWQATRRFRLSGQARHHGPYFSDPLNDRESRVPRGTIVDARAEYRFERASLFAYVRNVFDALVLTTRDEFLATAEDPREIGIGIEGRF